MELEFHQLDLRYERLRVVRPAREKRLLASLAEAGQQVPILVVTDATPSRYVVIDGYYAEFVIMLRAYSQGAIHGLQPKVPGSRRFA